MWNAGKIISLYVRSLRCRSDVLGSIDFVFFDYGCEFLFGFLAVADFGDAGVCLRDLSYDVPQDRPAPEGKRPVFEILESYPPMAFFAETQICGAEDPLLS